MTLADLIETAMPGGFISGEKLRSYVDWALRERPTFWHTARRVSVWYLKSPREGVELSPLLQIILWHYHVVDSGLTLYDDLHPRCNACYLPHSMHAPDGKCSTAPRYFEYRVKS